MRKPILFLDIEFENEHDRELFMSGYEFALWRIQEDKRKRGKEYELAIPFAKKV